VRKTKVSAAGIEMLRKALPKCKIEWDGSVMEPKIGFAPLTDADVQRIAALPAAEQVEEVRKELMRRNPGFAVTGQKQTGIFPCPTVPTIRQSHAGTR
jgi:hypothetical protein